jgi:uncharacterized protein YndB with AHSA1/START domain
MARNYTVSTRISKPVADVFDAVVSSDKLARYFASGSSDLVEGTTVIWHWEGYGEAPVVVEKVVENQRIELTLDSKKWQKTKEDSYAVSIIFEFEALDDGGTMLSISEDGWKTDQEGLKASHDNCGGWQHMGLSLKVWIEHGIDLRE